MPVAAAARRFHQQSARWAGRFQRTALLRRAIAALTLQVLFLAMALGGRSYVYCRAMGEVMTAVSTCTCAAVQVQADGQASWQANPDCFEHRSHDKLVSFTTSASYVVQAAPLVALLAPTSPGPAEASTVTSRAEHPIRAGPHGPTSSRAMLMVYLT